MLQEWVIEKLNSVRDNSIVLIKDPYQLTKGLSNILHSWGKENSFSILPAATNMVFRWKYNEAKKDPSIKKFLILDLTPASRLKADRHKAIPLFYPDVIYACGNSEIVMLDLQDYLKTITKDDLWPAIVNDPRISKLIRPNLGNILKAYKNLRLAHPTRFTDKDFETILVFACLGIPEEAFKKISEKDYWEIGLLSHQNFDEVENLFPDAIRTIKDDLRNAPAPFCYFADNDPRVVSKLYFFSLILSQHTTNWKLLLANLDPLLQPFTNIDLGVIKGSFPLLLAKDIERTKNDILSVEEAIDEDGLNLIMTEVINSKDLSGYWAALQKEKYSSLLSSIYMLHLLSLLISETSVPEIASEIYNYLTSNSVNSDKQNVFSAFRQSTLEAYTLFFSLKSRVKALDDALKLLDLKITEKISFGLFWELWNGKQVNRLEYQLSLFERKIFNDELIPQEYPELKKYFENILMPLKEKTSIMSQNIHQKLDRINYYFQDFVHTLYPKWTDSSLMISENKPCLTSQFLSKFVKPNWEYSSEKAVFFIFDGMRYDIWDELLKPLLLDKMDFIEEVPSISILPSETQLTRKAISAGAFPNEFDSNDPENILLESGLNRVFNKEFSVVLNNPEYSSTGETVRYKTENLDVYIFELCDKELHKIHVKKLADGREALSRPLSFIYDQTIRNIFENEILSIVKAIAPGTKIFVTADHGFVRVGRKSFAIDKEWLFQYEDCSYQNAWLTVTPENIQNNAYYKNQMLVFTPGDLRVSDTIISPNKELSQKNKYKSVVFPRTGLSFARPGSNFRPDAYSHGGVSLQELIIPMVMMKMKGKTSSFIEISDINAPEEVIEGELIKFNFDIQLSQNSRMSDLKCVLEYKLDHSESEQVISKEILLVTKETNTINLELKIDSSSIPIADRKKEFSEQMLYLSLSYMIDNHQLSQALTHRFRIKINNEKIIRRVGNLGSILGLSPKK